MGGILNMNILIYDDNIYDISHLSNLIENLFQDLNIDFQITVCKSTEFLLKNIKKFDFLFLDVEIHEENGIEIGKKLTKIAHTCEIIITSSFKKYLIEGYKIRASRYFLKPINQDEFNTEMKNEIFLYLQQNNGFINQRISNEKILFSDILYIDTYNRKTRIHFTNGKILNTSLTMKEWVASLDSEIFNQPHKSYIVNLTYISSISDKDLYLINNEIIPISRNIKKQFQQHYIDILPRLL